MSSHLLSQCIKSAVIAPLFPYAFYRIWKPHAASHPRRARNVILVVALATLLTSGLVGIVEHVDSPSERLRLVESLLNLVASFFFGIYLFSLSLSFQTFRGRLFKKISINICEYIVLVLLLLLAAAIHLSTILFSQILTLTLPFSILILTALSVAIRILLELYVGFSFFREGRKMVREQQTCLANAGTVDKTPSPCSPVSPLRRKLSNLSYFSNPWISGTVSATPTTTAKPEKLVLHWISTVPVQLSVSCLFSALLYVAAIASPQYPSTFKTRDYFACIPGKWYEIAWTALLVFRVAWVVFLDFDGHRLSILVGLEHKQTQQTGSQQTYPLSSLSQPQYKAYPDVLSPGSSVHRLFSPTPYDKDHTSSSIDNPYLYSPAASRTGTPENSQVMPSVKVLSRSRSASRPRSGTLDSIHSYASKSQSAAYSEDIHGSEDGFVVIPSSLHYVNDLDYTASISSRHGSRQGSYSSKRGGSPLPPSPALLGGEPSLEDFDPFVRSPSVNAMHARIREKERRLGTTSPTLSSHGEEEGMQSLHSTLEIGGSNLERYSSIGSRISIGGAEMLPRPHSRSSRTNSVPPGHSMHSHTRSPNSATFKKNTPVSSSPLSGGFHGVSNHAYSQSVPSLPHLHSNIQTRLSKRSHSSLASRASLGSVARMITRDSFVVPDGEVVVAHHGLIIPEIPTMIITPNSPVSPPEKSETVVNFTSI